ncbi:glycoside hydrolase family 47 protein [Hyaloscypha variabilis]
MLRYRRYRVFLIFAVILTLVFVRLRNTRDWAQYPLGADPDDTPSQKEDSFGGSSPARTTAPAQIEKPKEIPTSKTQQRLPSSSPTPKGFALSTPAAAKPISTPESISVPQIVLPDREPLPPTKVSIEEEGLNLHPVAPPGRQELPTWSAVPTTIHWEKQTEHFPVPTESIIHLPTGIPVKIPKIQHNFNDETPTVKINREKRQSRVKEEFKKAWTGYQKHAWLHDELSPVTGNFRDPFCGWAATLVDALDTLWIMGLEDEFEEAAKAIDSIDFTTSPRGDIPMFETTIRYLGGLLAAYDVSGGKYPNLLAKAEELGEILIGAFDTPNRMPVLYYRWKPTFASQPHRAGQRSNLAELGSLSMEFTRLAQLTKDHRYYDAIARITIALSDWQDRGTQLPGVFPDNVDASGCNRTSPVQLPKSISGEAPTSPVNNAEEPIGFQPVSPDTVKEPKPRKKKVKGDTNDHMLEVQVLPGEPSKAQILGWAEDLPIKDKKKKVQKRDVIEERSPIVDTATPATPDPPIDTITGLPLDIPAAQAAVGHAVGEWDCVAQGLEPASPGRGRFSMGGGQDSTYEYFPKEYLLLGGLDETYRKMYLKTIDAIRKWMLYRPMVPDNRDILFSGSVLTMGEPELDLMLSGDVEHLTCFIGGMVGMSAKIFGIEGDLEIAKRLADGCVWAYESTLTGIMPEGATVMPCKSSAHCTWNETLYHEFLDPIGPQRDENLRRYLENKAAREAEEEEQRQNKAAALKTEAELSNANSAGSAEVVSDEILDELPDHPGSAALRNDDPVSLHKRGSGDVPAARGAASQDLPPVKSMYQQKAEHTESELASMAEVGRTASNIPVHPHAASTTPTKTQVFYDPGQPLSHKEYVQQIIAQQSLPPGFVSIKSRKYILRPEAIESVWYMYRITGDETWQDKGWRMFESIINATSTEYGHSAIYDVLDSDHFQIDEMESFWLAETLKYFYLLYSTPDVISLDEWVLNTEAHPFKRPAEGVKL